MMADENESDFEIINEGGVTDDYLSVDGIELPDKEVEDEKVEKLYRRDPIVHRAVEKGIGDLFGLRPSVEGESEEIEDAVEELLFGKKTDLYKNFKKASKGSYLNWMSLIYLNYDNSEEGDFSLDWGDVLPPDHEEEAGVLSKTAVAVERLYKAEVVTEEEAREMLVEMTSVGEMG